MALTVLLVAATASMLFYVLLSTLLTPRVKVSSRIEVLSGGAVAQRPSRREAKVARKPVRPWLTRLEQALHRAEIDLPAREYVTRWGIITLCLALLFILGLGPAGPVLAIGVSGLVTALYIRARGQRRLRRVNEGIHEMLTVVANSLRAGHSFAQALHVVAEELDGPLHEELRRIEAEMQVGVSTEDALQRANERIGSDDFDLVVTAILIQRQIGGNLAEVIEKITDTIRERIRLKREVKALTAQGRLSANLFMVMPPGLGLLIYFINPSYIGVLFTSPLGWGMLGMALVGQLIGYFFIRRIVNVEL